MAGADRIVQAMRKIGKGAVPQENLADLIYGTVKSISPLKIEVESKFVLEAEQLILSALCELKTFQLIIPAHTHPINIGQVGESQPGGEINMTLNLWRGLQTGDTVIMLRINNGQTFYVMERVGAL